MGGGLFNQDQALPRGCNEVREDRRSWVIMQESGCRDRELRAHGEERNRQHGMGARETGGGGGDTPLWRQNCNMAAFRMRGK